MQANILAVHPGDEEAQRAEILRANTRPYPMHCGYPMFFSTFNEKEYKQAPQHARFYCTICKHVELPAFLPLAPYSIKLARLVYNNTTATLADAIWRPYSPTHRNNPYGCNGYIFGTVVEGNTFSRLFHATSNQAWKAGETYQQDYVSLSHVRRGFGKYERDVLFEHHTCG